MMDTVKARREELVKNHEQLLAQYQQVGVALERTRGAIALCDELIQAGGPAENEQDDTPA